MDERCAERRDFLRQVTALGAVSIVAALRPSLAQAGAAPERSGTKMSYGPAAKLELKVSEVEFRRTAAGRQLMARIYQPQGGGAFPTGLDLHGGARGRQDPPARGPV